MTAEDESYASNEITPVKKDDDDNKKLQNGKHRKDDDSSGTAKKKYADWPFREIKEPHDNDVLYGRGGGTNHHPGNKRYRKMVEDRKIDYVNRKRLDKPLVALEIIREWRGQSPPGRFLKLDEKTGLWFDVGDKKAREKTSQALREKAPLIRKQQEEERDKGDGNFSESDDDDEGEERQKTTRFAEGTNLKEKDPTKPILARDHSLGREYLEPNADYTLEGFSWREPLAGEEVAAVGSVSEYLRATSIGSFTSQQNMPPPPMYHPSNRIGSNGFVPIPPPGDPYRFPSHGSMGPPPPLPHPNSYEHVSSGDHMRYSSWGRFESWGSVPGFGPPVPSYSYPPPHTLSWSRDHSLGQNPLSHASVNQPAHPAAFEGRVVPHPHHGPYYPPSPDRASTHYNPNGTSDNMYPHYRSSDISTTIDAGPPHYRSSTSDGTIQHYPPSSNSPPPPSPYESQTSRDYGSRGRDHPKSPSYTIDPAVASQWSGQDAKDIAKSLSTGSEEQDKFPISNSTTFQSSMKVPKPDIVKRATSNQNETFETKPDLVGPSVKRAALNRDNSMASNRLKEQYVPGYFDSEKEVKLLSENLEQSNIGSDSTPRPTSISNDDRTSTIDKIEMDLMVRPVKLSSQDRSSTIDALALDLDDVEEQAFDMQFLIEEQSLPRPSALTAAQRLTTTEVLDLVNEPIPEDEDF